MAPTTAKVDGDGGTVEGGRLEWLAVIMADFSIIRTHCHVTEPCRFTGIRGDVEEVCDDVLEYVIVLESGAGEEHVFWVQAMEVANRLVVLVEKVSGGHSSFTVVNYIATKIGINRVVQQTFSVLLST
ncbi:hypothetical protein V6N13_093836 [Hibiscus sabdariffa]